MGTRVQHHHLVPKAKKGRATVPVHPICHKTIHAHVTNAELARMDGDRAALLDMEQISRFVKWVGNKPPDFNAKTRTPQ